MTTQTTDNGPDNRGKTDANIVGEESYGSDEFQFIKMKREWAGDAWDSERDAYSKEARMAAWDRIEERHHENKHRKRPYRDMIVLFSGDRGSGKTNLSTMMGAIAYEQGMEVFSSASFLFGYRIDPVQIYTFAEAVPDNSFMFIDEAHILADRYAEQSTRNRTLASCISLLRKKGIRLVLASVQEDRIAWSLKGEVQTLIYPRTYRPRVRRPKFPPWCYIRATMIGPNPYQGRKMSDQWDIPRPQGPTRKVEKPPVKPLYIYQAAKLSDTWAKPNILDGINTTADAIKSGATSQQQTQTEFEQKGWDYLHAIASAINRGFNIDSMAKGRAGTRSIEHKMLTRVAREHGWEGTDKEALAILKERVGLNSQYKVIVEDFMKLFSRKSKKRE